MKETKIYKQLDNCQIRADVYAHGAGSPVLVYLHGGGFIFGSRSWLPLQQIQWYKNAGYSIVSVDYRLAPGAKLADIVEDLKDAVRWVREQAVPHYRFDPERIALIGSSAGAYLSLLAGTIEEIRPKAIVSFYGYGDIIGDWIMKPSSFYNRRPKVTLERAKASIGNVVASEGSWARYDYYMYCRQNGNWVEEVTGYDRAEDLDALQAYCPILGVTHDYPPTLLLHGDRDTDVPYEQSLHMYAKLRQAGVDCKLITIEGGDHVFDQNFHSPEVGQAFEEVNLFLQHYL
ncbi:alpha/beta hydrolase [Paenibacillus aceti]|uniref:Esterase n=1 Tax=Paenibacillus aceti TaxID=1820010 RepID=A0ABQ1VWR2_9BACL|nr:alpha/beta hydrolase [Paenibacillus aceti]GGG03251.1 esterase [Paenibacillus aceti]